MTQEELGNLILNNSDKLNDIKFIASILNGHNNLFRFNILNRIAIALQKDNAYDLKSEEEWQIIGRFTKKEAKPIFITMPHIKSSYIDTKNNKEFINNDLNPDEIILALQYGLLRHNSNIDRLYVEAVYDISDTYSKTKSTYRVNTPLVDSGSILYAFELFTGYSINKSDKLKLNYSDRLAYIPDYSYKKFVNSMIAIMLKIIEHDKLNKYLDSMNIADISDNLKSELINCIKYSLCSILNINSELDIKEILSIDVSKKIAILNIVNNIVFEFATSLKFKYRSETEDASEAITNIKKAGVILDIFESNYVIHKLNGN